MLPFPLFPALAVSLALAQPLSAGGPQEGVVTADILPGWQTERGTYMAGVHLRLAPGWKTYWRAPGDAGIPPRFDWDGSQNVQSVRLHWPTPDVFESNGMRTIGYREEVVLPVELTPNTPGQPIELRARVELGVCQDICMPMELVIAGQMPSANGRDAPIRAALAAQPLSATEADVGQVDCTVEPISDGLRLTAEIEMPQMGRHEATVFEVPDASIWVSEAQTARKGGRLVAQSDLVPLSGAPFALDRSSVRITVLGDGRAVDIQGCNRR